MREAAAEHAGERLLQLRVGGARIPVEQRLGAEDHAAEAEAALHGLLVDEGLLYRVRLLGRAEPLERGDVRAADGLHRRDAGPRRLAVDDDGAGAALAEPAPELRS